MWGNVKTMIADLPNKIWGGFRCICVCKRHSGSQIVQHRSFTQLHCASVFRLYSPVTLPFQLAEHYLAASNQKRQIFARVARMNPHAQNRFLDTCQLWLHLIRYGCFLIVPVVQGRSDLNKSAAELHLLIAIVSPWKVFQIMAVVFSRRGLGGGGMASLATRMWEGPS